VIGKTHRFFPVTAALKVRTCYRSSMVNVRVIH
jgi:hypothetical protein